MIVVAQYTASTLVEWKAQIGEGPRWDTEKQELVWVDIKSGSICRTDPASRNTIVISVPSEVGVAEFREDGGYVLGVKEGIALVDENGDNYEVIHRVSTASDAVIRMNDGGCDPAGRFWVGSMHDTELERGTLYCFEAGKEPAARIDPVSISNGIAWSKDASTMYYVDSPRGAILAYDYDEESGEIENERTVVQIDKGIPDGLVLDHDGDIWVALYKGAEVRQYTPDGECTASIAVPAPHVTSCEFGGPNLSTLFITTARAELSDEELAEFPLSGSLFKCDVAAKGVERHRFSSAPRKS